MYTYAAKLIEVIDGDTGKNELVCGTNCRKQARFRVDRRVGLCRAAVTGVRRSTGSVPVS